MDGAVRVLYDGPDLVVVEYLAFFGGFLVVFQEFGGFLGAEGFDLGFFLFFGGFGLGGRGGFLLGLGFGRFFGGYGFGPGVLAEEASQEVIIVDSAQEVFDVAFAVLGHGLTPLSLRSGKWVKFPRVP